MQFRVSRFVSGKIIGSKIIGLKGQVQQQLRDRSGLAG
jgi:hypothetical protein